MVEPICIHDMRMERDNGKLQTQYIHIEDGREWALTISDYSIYTKEEINKEIETFMHKCCSQWKENNPMSVQQVIEFLTNKGIEVHI